MQKYRWWFITAVIAFVAATAGSLVANRLSARHANETDVHSAIHATLSLSPAQDKAIEALETTHRLRKSEFEAQLRAANAELAAAIEEERAFGPRVTAAVDKIHVIMGAMQKESLDHLFAMRQQLDGRQAAAFDAIIRRTLTAERR